MLPVDIAGGCEVELFSVHEVQVLLGLITCEGCLVVGCDHGPQAEVAQGVGPGLSLNAEVNIRKGWKENGGTK